MHLHHTSCIAHARGLVAIRVYTFTPPRAVEDVRLTGRLGAAHVPLLRQRLLLQYLHGCQRLGKAQSTSSGTGTRGKEYTLFLTPCLRAMFSGTSVSLASKARAVSQTILLEAGQDHTIQRRGIRNFKKSVLCFTVRPSNLCVLPDFRQMLESKQAKFAELASKESDCSSARKGGDLGHFGRGQMQSEPLLV